MKYLTPDIEAMMKNKPSKSLVKPTTSCGIFQDCMDTKQAPLLYHQQKKKSI